MAPPSPVQHLLTNGPRSLLNLFSLTRWWKCHLERPNSLSPAQHASIAQYVIDQSGLDADALLVSSAADLTSAPADAVEVVEFAEAGSVMDMARSAGAFAMRRVDDFKPVTTEELNQPDAADWLNWRRTPDGHAHSPLVDISRDNVSTEYELVNGHARGQQPTHPAGARRGHVPDPCPQQDSGDRGRNR